MSNWTDAEAFELARRMCVAHGGDPDAPIYQGHGQVGENWQVYLPMAVEALVMLRPAISDAQIEAFGFAFWPVNAATKIGTNRDELRAALAAALYLTTLKTEGV